MFDSNPNRDAGRAPETVFYHALELAPQERDAFLATACATDPQLLNEVKQLISAHEESERLFGPDEAIGGAGGTSFRVTAAELNRLKPEEPGQHIGQYKLLEQIGEGGFGTVWMAEQEKPIRRRVALKIIKLGMDTKDVVARFEQERQALAMMDHPNIARVIDAGATQFGRPYFVMELVRGIRITDYCDQAQLPTGERLKLFLEVCRAVQHAHQKGVIHRDLKPSNILVTLHDGVPVPKVIDFGVAKATQQQRLTDLTFFTKFEQMIGTPLYMAPEQAEMSGLDVDTRSDIYSLGVLLYELLTGRTPFDHERLANAGIDEMRRVIREQEPPKPSTLLSTMKNDARIRVAHHRQSEVSKLIDSVAGDLDWIVMKALEKDRSRRYETAAALGEDVQRHLASEPVSAGPPSTRYRFGKFVRRNRRAIAGGAAVLSALLAGLTASTWLFLKERHARERAEAAEKKQQEAKIEAVRETEMSSQVVKILTGMLSGVGPEVAKGRDTELLRNLLDDTAQRLGGELKAQPIVEATLRAIIGDAYSALGDTPKAIAMHTDALALRQQAFGDEHELVADSSYSLGATLLENENPKQAAARIRKALVIRQSLFGNSDARVIQALGTLGNALNASGEYLEAEKVLREALDSARRLWGAKHPKLVAFLNGLGVCLCDLRENVAAEDLFREALQIGALHQGEDHPEHAILLFNLAHAMGRERAVEARELREKALSLVRRQYGATHPTTQRLSRYYANSLRLASDLPAAVTSYRGILAEQQLLQANLHQRLVDALTRVADYLVAQNRPKDAETCRRMIVTLNELRCYAEDLQTAVARGELASILAAQGKIEEAEPLFQQAFTAIRLQGKSKAGYLLNPMLAYVNVLETQDRPDELAAAWREIVAAARVISSPKLESYAQQLALLLQKQKKYAEAEPLFREIAEKRRSAQLRNDEHAFTAIAQWARMLADWAWTERPGQPAAAARSSTDVPAPAERAAKAEQLLREVLAGRLKGVPGHWRLPETKARLGATLVVKAAVTAEISADAKQTILREAEALLLESEQALRILPDVTPNYKLYPVQWLVSLYQVWDRPKDATVWQAKLTSGRDPAAEFSGESSQQTGAGAK